MSEGDVSLIRDEDVLRRMWQQTEDFGRKKEIRAHMYRLREERLRTLYSPDPPQHHKGVESATHVTSLLDQSFQGLKSKEVRDAGSPPKDFGRQELTPLSTAGWNVQTEQQTSADGLTSSRALTADVRGGYDVQGGRGQFAAVDSHRQVHSEYQDGNTSVKKDEASSKTAHNEQVVRQTDDGSHFSSTKTSSSSSSNFQQVSSTTEVPYTIPDESVSRQRSTDTRNVTNTSDYEKTLRSSNFENGELLSRKVDYPDGNTKVIVETRCLPDGTRVTSTRKEFLAPAQTTRHSRSETAYSNTSHRADTKESSKITREYDIVESQRQADDYDFKRNRIHDDNSQVQRNIQTTSDTKRFDSRDSSSKITRETADRRDVSDSKFDTTDSSSKIIHETVDRRQGHSDTKFDTRDTSSKIVRETVDRRQDISDTQGHVDDYNCKSNIKINQSTRTDDVKTERVNQRYETKTDTNQRDIIKSDDKIDRTDNSSVHRSDRHDSKSDETDRREIITSRDNQNIRDVKESNYVKNDKERIHNITRDQKHEEIVEKQTSDQYQTTYQSDFTQKKISNDWSPSHQAWASTLRGDTPSSTRPTTRASSPGSRTYHSSASSLRSSVSPDKFCRKPTNRGGSPNKTDRSSPSRYSTDRYSSTTSTHTVTESRNSKHTSPDRKPPKSPTRYGGSPDRKPDGYQQRPSQSPEKRPQEYRPSSSPERRPGTKPTDGYPSTISPSRPANGSPRSSASPDRKPIYQPSDRPSSGYPHATSPTRSSPEKFADRPKDISFGRPSTSPDRTPGYKGSPVSSPKGSKDYPRNVSPTRPYTKDSVRISSSPDRKPGYEHPRPSSDLPKESSPTRPSASPDKKPSYMRPTAASQTSDRRSPTKHVPSQSPERKPYGKTTIKEDHYKFIDEETKMYTRNDRDDTTYTKTTSSSTDKFSGPRDQSPSPSRSPDDVPDHSRADSPSLRSSLRKGSRSPSPPKGPVTFTDEHTHRTEKIKITASDVTNKYDEDITKTSSSSKPTRDVPREPSPTKYGTYDKKRRTEETEEISSFSSRKDSTDVKYDSLTRRDKTIKKTESPLSPTKPPPKDNKISTEALREPSPNKHGTYDKKRRSEEIEEITSTTKNTTDIKYDSLTRKTPDSHRKVPESPSSPIKKHPRESVSPVKSPMKDTKYKHTTDFITTERTTEEINKKTTLKDRPRQLVTPSTSPTRKPKTDDTAPSTGQSSPTTSVSGFVYFSSPKTENTIVTDLDDEEYFSTITKSEAITTTISERPKTLNVERSPSPSKIPCRSPSVETKKTPTKDSLPRKSSLKKPSTESINLSPEEKPPSSFRVSPTVEVPQHKVVKKDRPDKPVDSPIKPKAPFERRETYEERCLKILGVVDDDSQTESMETVKLRSSSVSPCRSPDQRESSPLRFYTDEKEINSVSEFISSEKDDTIKKTTSRFEDTVTSTRNLRTPSRETSPAKLQDIISQKTVTKHWETEDVQRESISKITRDSPNRDIGYHKPRSNSSPEKKSPQIGKDTSPVRPSQSPDRKRQVPKTVDSIRLTSPSKSVPQQGSPTKPIQPTKSSSVKPAEEQPKEKPRPSVSPDRKPGYMKSTASTTQKFESYETSEDHETTIRRTVDKETGYRKTKDESPHRPSTSPERDPDYCLPSIAKTVPEKEEKFTKRSSVSPDKTPGYMRPTAATITKFEETSVSEDMTESAKDMITTETVHKHSTSKIPEKISRSSSPTKKPTEAKQPRTQSPSKKTTIATDDTTLLIQSEREIEVLDRVQQSLRKLSPNREQKSPIREKSPGKTTISLQDIDVVTTEISQTSTKVCKEDTVKTSSDKSTSAKTDITRTVRPNDKPKEQKPVTKTPSRTVSPTKKPASSTKQDSSPDSTDKSRSISPKKPLSPTERPQSPHVSKPSGIKPREPTPSSLIRKPSGNVSPKTEKVATDIKKTATITKQNSISKIATKTTTSRIPSSTSKPELEPKRAPTPKGINKENVSPRKEDVKVTRTASDTSLKNKKPSPQRMKSKPEIQVNDLSPTRTPKTSNLKKPSGRETPTKLAPKPKSATALNSTKDDDEIIIDVEQAKSSRENSPDRICPTPVNFTDDVGTPRYPDDVCEPDDDFRNRTHHTIHETESIVDDIVEISEDDELFVKKTDLDHVTKSDECLLSVTDKVSKFSNKIETLTKPKDTTTLFKDVERRVHSDFIDESLKSDECLLSVSEKVNKFAKGPQEKRDKSPSRRIVDEFDTETVYQDDYTKLSVNDKAHLFIETAENSKAPKTKPAQKVERPDLNNVDESLKSDECLLSVSDKVHKFVKTAEQFLQESHETEDKERRVKEQYEKFMQQIGQDDIEDNIQETKATSEFTKTTEIMDRTLPEDKTPSFAKETASSHTKIKEYVSPNLKPVEKTPIVKITTLRSSEAVKKAKALFENISTTQQTKETKTTKLLDIGVTKKSPKTDSTTVLHPSVEDLPCEPEIDLDDSYNAHTKEHSMNGTPTKFSQPRHDDRRSSPSRHTTHSPEIPRTKSPSRHSFETTTITTKTVLSRYPAAHIETPKKSRPDIEKIPKPTPEPKQTQVETEKPEKIPSYQRPTATSQIKEEKTIEETEVSSRRGSGKFGVELRRTSVERSTISSERRRSSTDHHQPCIEDIFDLDLLEQMLEKVVGYEQRRRIRAQIRVARKKLESKTDTTYTRHTKQTTTTKTRSPERRPLTKSPERQKSTPVKTEYYTASIPQKSTPQSDHNQPKEHSKPLMNGHAKEPSNVSEKRQRPQSPEKPRPALKTQSPVRQPSPEKKLRTASPTKVSPKPKSNRFNEYASAYMKKVGLNETDKVKLFNKTKRTTDDEDVKAKQSKVSKKTDIEDQTTTQKTEEHSMMEMKSTSMSKNFSERTSSKETIEVVQVNGKRSLSPEKKRSPVRHIQSPSERLYQRSPSPDFKRKTDLNKKETIIKTVYETEPRVTKKETIIRTVVEERPKVDSRKETIIKTVYDVDKKMTPKQAQEEKPSWAVNRNLKKVSSESRSFSSRKVEEKKVGASPGKALVRPIDAVVSSYGPGPLDADGRPLFGIKALRNGSSNYQVKGTVIRQEFHSRNGGEPEGSVSVTAYSTEPEDLDRLLQSQGERPSRIHGLAAITTTKKFGGETGTTLKEAHSKEERAALEQFTHNERRVSEDVDMREGRLHREERAEERRERQERREDKKTVRQSSVKSLTEKYIKSASDTSKSERAAYPKAGLILRTANLKDSVSSDSSAHAGLGRTSSAHSLGSDELDQLASPSPHSPHSPPAARGERSFLDSSTKVSGVQDILTRMRNAIVIEDGDTTEDSEARALLNKFLGATVLMAGMQGYMQGAPAGRATVRQETTRTTSSGGKTTTSTSRRVEEIDLDQCWDERLLRKLLEESTDYEQRRRIRARIRNLMAEQEACATAVSEALGGGGAAADDAREEAEVTVTSSVRRDSSEKTVSSSTTTKSSKVIESVARPAPKTVSPFAKFRQLEKQNSLNSPNSPQSPSSGSPAPYFRFTDPALHASALTIKERLLQWCRDKTRDYENVKLENFSTSWADGLAFCALVHHFLPTAFDYSKLTPQQRRHNFTLAFKVADEKAGIYPLLDVDDMVAMRKPDWKCVFTYVQAIHRRFKDEP